MSLVLNAFTASWDTTGMAVSNQQLFRETDLSPITSIVHGCKLRLYGHVAHHPDDDPAYRIVSERDNSAWKRPRGRPQRSWLWQVDAFCRKLLSIGRDSVRGLVRRDCREWRHRVGEAVCSTVYAQRD